MGNRKNLQVKRSRSLRFLLSLEILGHVPRTIFQPYYHGCFVPVAMQSSRRIFILICMLKSVKLEGCVFQKRNLLFFPI